VIVIVDARDQQCCVRCGKWLSNNGSRHHRQRRAVGGHLVVNLILLCGSGTTGCHGWVHANPARARAEGLIVRASIVDVGMVPIRILDLLTGRFIHVLLTPEGGRVEISDEYALEQLALAA
jgi:hypothetical protein